MISLALQVAAFLFLAVVAIVGVVILCVVLMLIFGVPDKFKKYASLPLDQGEA